MLPFLHLAVVAIKKRAFGLSFTKVANFTCITVSNAAIIVCLITSQLVA